MRFVARSAKQLEPAGRSGIVDGESKFGPPAGRYYIVAFRQPQYQQRKSTQRFGLYYIQRLL